LFRAACERIAGTRRTPFVGRTAEGRPAREDRPPALRDECRSLRGIPRGEGLPFMLQDRVVEDAPPAPGPPARLATDAFASEAAFLVASDPTQVVLVHVEP